MATTQYAKAKIKWPVFLERDDRSMEGVTLNLSTNGAFIRCAKPPKLNEIFEMTINVPNSDRSLKVSVEVVWSNIYGPDDQISPRGMGVYFLDISDEDRQVIAKEILQQLKSDDKKIETKKLENLQTLIIDQGEIGSTSSLNEEMTLSH